MNGPNPETLGNRRIRFSNSRHFPKVDVEEGRRARVLALPARAAAQSLICHAQLEEINRIPWPASTKNRQIIAQ